MASQDVSGVLVPVAIAGVVNGIAKYKEHGASGTVQIVFANLALFTMLAGVGQFLDWHLAGTFAVIYLIATMLTTGAPVIAWFTALVNGKAN